MQDSCVAGFRHALVANLPSHMIWKSETIYPKEKKKQMKTKHSEELELKIKDMAPQYSESVPHG